MHTQHTRSRMSKEFLFSELPGVQQDALRTARSNVHLFPDTVSKDMGKILNSTDVAIPALRKMIVRMKKTAIPPECADLVKVIEDSQILSLKGTVVFKASPPLDNAPSEASRPAKRRTTDSSKYPMSVLLRDFIDRLGQPVST